jgi:hypothetical protein
MFVASWLRHQAGRAAHRSTNGVLPCGLVGKFSVAGLGGLVLWSQIQLLRWPGSVNMRSTVTSPFTFGMLAVPAKP